jgi:hypothetical protein
MPTALARSCNTQLAFDCTPTFRLTTIFELYEYLQLAVFSVEHSHHIAQYPISRIAIAQNVPENKLSLDRG